MNIFATHHDPSVAALWLDDKRVNKMATESTQLLSNALRAHGLAAPYRLTHGKHPCSIWAAESAGNYEWLMNHALALCWIFSRVGRKGFHGCEAIIRSLPRSIPAPSTMTPFRNCARNTKLGIDFTHVQNVHTAYQLYLNARWPGDKRAPTWKHRDAPQWLEQARGRVRPHQGADEDMEVQVRRPAPNRARPTKIRPVR